MKNHERRGDDRSAPILTIKTQQRMLRGKAVSFDVLQDSGLRPEESTILVTPVSWLEKQWFFSFKETILGQAFATC